MLPLRILPLGDSITEWDCRLNAYTSADDKAIFSPLDATPAFSIFPKGAFWVASQGGYRGPLASLLSADESAPSWSYVGRQFRCGSHEGYSGQTIEWLGDNVVADAIDASLPDIILLLAGTNDFYYAPPRGSRDPNEVAARLHKVLDTTFDRAPNATVLLSTVTPINATRCAYYHTAPWHPSDCPDDMQANIEKYNQLLPGVIAARQQQGRDITLVAQPNLGEFDPADFWIWGIHFNSSGFEKMAARWHASIVSSAPWTRGRRARARRGAVDAD